MQTCQERSIVVESVKARSLDELQRALWVGFVLEHDEISSQMKEAKAALVEIEVEEKRFLFETMERFKTFPPLQRQVKELLPMDNATMRVLLA